MVKRIPLPRFPYRSFFPRSFYRNGVDAIAVGVAVTMFLAAKNLYLNKGVLPEEREGDIKGFAKVLYHKYYIDEIYETFIVKPFSSLSILVL